MNYLTNYVTPIKKTVHKSVSDSHITHNWRYRKLIKAQLHITVTKQTKYTDYCQNGTNKQMKIAI